MDQLQRIIIWALLITSVIVTLCLHGTEGRQKRCYVCRSRGELGDCKDPFAYNFTTVETQRAVQVSDCASGWCGKIVENKDIDVDAATERFCLQRPPEDTEERCSDAFLSKQRVFMCFCRGDLCNTGVTHRLTNFIFVIMLFISSYCL